MALRRARQRRSRTIRRRAAQAAVAVIIAAVAMAPGLLVAAVALTEIRTLRVEVDLLRSDLADLQGVVSYLAIQDRLAPTDGPGALDRATMEEGTSAYPAPAGR